MLPHFVQLDYILANFRLQTVEVWNDFALPIGLDHRCAHCILQFQCSSPPRVRRHRGLKRWQPTLDPDGLPARFHNILHRNKIRGHRNSLGGLERSLRDAGQQGGNCETTYLRFRPSEGLKNLRAQRRETRDAQLRKSLTFTIRKNHRQEVRVWKIERLNAQLGHARNWRTLRSMQFATKGFGQQQAPQPNAFADMLGQIFAGNPDRPCRASQSDRKPVVNAWTSMCGGSDENSHLFHDILLQWKYSIMLEQDAFSDAGEDGAGSTTIRFQAHCKHPFVVIKNICLHDFGSH